MSKTTPDKPIPAVGYLRMSSDKQETSIDIQRTEIEKYADAHNIQILRWYADEGVSGWKAKERVEFQRMIDEAARLSDFELVLCHDQDRFSRFDPLEFNHYCYLLRQAGVGIETVRQGRLDLETLAGWLQTNIHNHGANEYSSKLSERVCLGRHKQAAAGKWVSPCPYAYRVMRPHDEYGKPMRNHPDFGKWIIHEDEAAVVRSLFEQYAETDTSLYAMADELNKQGIPSPGGGKWLVSSIQCVLRREAYTGVAHQFKECRGTFHTIDARGDVSKMSNKPKRYRDRKEWLAFDCPAIVDRNLWERVQRKMTDRGLARSTHSRRGGGRKGVLAGLVYCAHCGEPMYRQGERKGRTKAENLGAVYVCSSYVENGRAGCRRHGIREKPLLDYIVPLIRDIVLAPANFERLRAEIKRQIESKRTHEPKSLDRERKRLNALDGELKAALKEMRRCPDDLYELACDNVRELRQQRDDVARRVEALETMAGASPQTIADEVEQALAGLESLRERFDASDPKVAREALQRIVERIDLWFEPISEGKHARSRFQKGLIKFKVPDSYSQFNLPR